MSSIAFSRINKGIVDAAIEEFNITPEQMREIDRLALMGV